MEWYGNIIVAIIALVASVASALINSRYRRYRRRRDLGNKLVNHPIHHRLKSYKRRFLIDFKLDNKGKEMILRDLFIKKFEL